MWSYLARTAQQVHQAQKISYSTRKPDSIQNRLAAYQASIGMKLSPRARGSLLVPLSYSGKVADALPRVDVGSVAHLSTTYNIQCTPGDSHLTSPSGELSTARRRRPGSAHEEVCLNSASSSAPVVANHCPPLSEPTSHFSLPPPYAPVPCSPSTLSSKIVACVCIAWLQCHSPVKSIITMSGFGVTSPC
ncbi:hypothetical protein JG688_00009347 [Phytophthora aleatoria]|uniref:Uncharacterized protein n=1 Tax=Phytophthora aleatoria TaxID=2496075 RepID=A0A8J5IGB6_9STRA|nr:hypothetical protein JG688_00009347 [Phytophthora aleatoria]